MIDFYQAQKDLRQKAIRVLHNLSFVEDPTRVFRAIRFEQRLGFTLGAHTESLLKSAIRMGFVDKVSGPRVFNELVIIFREPEPLSSLRRMAELGLLVYLAPGLQMTKALEAEFEEAGRVIHWHDLLYTGRECRSWLVYLFCLLSELPAKAVREFCRRHGVPPKIARLLCDERKIAHDVQRLLVRRRQKKIVPKNSEMYRWLKPLSLEAVLYLMARCQSDEVRQWISNYYTHLRTVTTSLNGNDLQQLNVPEGPHFKKILDSLLDARLNGRVSSRDEELSFVKKRFASFIKS